MSKSSFKINMLKFVNILGPMIGLAVVIIIFMMFELPREKVLTSGGGWKNIFIQTSVIAVGAMGMTLIIASGGIDLSAGSIIAVSSVLGAKLATMGHSSFVVIAGVLATGTLLGLINGAIIVRFKMVPFIVTLGMMGIARGLAKWAGNSQAVNIGSDMPSRGLVDGFMGVENIKEFFPLPPGVWGTLLLAVLMTVVLTRTVFGRHLFAIGSNEETARLCGIKVGLNKVMIYTIGGFFFGLAGLMMLSRLGQGDPSTAVGKELEIIAAVVIGGASLSGGSGSIPGAMIGVLIMGVLAQCTQIVGWPSYFQEIIIGIIIILAVGVDKWRHKQFSI